MSGVSPLRDGRPGWSADGKGEGVNSLGGDTGGLSEESVLKIRLLVKPKTSCDQNVFFFASQTPR